MPYENDNIAKRELELFIDNDGDLYQSKRVPIQLNVDRSIRKATYDHSKAPRLWQYLVDEGARKYVKEYGAPGDSIGDIFPKAMREQLAQEYADRYRDEVRPGPGEEYKAWTYLNEPSPEPYEGAGKIIAYKEGEWESVGPYGTSEPNPVTLYLTEKGEQLDMGRWPGPEELRAERRDPDNPRLYENWEWDYEGPDESSDYDRQSHTVPGYGTFSILEKRDEFIIEHDGEELGKYRTLEKAQYMLGDYVKDIGANPANLGLPAEKDSDMPWKWLVGGLGLFAVWWLMKDKESERIESKSEPRPVAPVRPQIKDEFSDSPLWRKPTAEDEEYLAKVIVKESGDKGPSKEWAGIGWVAVNRANRKKRSIKKVVGVTSWPGGGSRGKAFVEDILSDKPLEHRRFPQALEIASSLLRGEIPNPIGPRWHFVHKRSLSRTNKPDGTLIPGKVSEKTGRKGGDRIAFGGRALPVWIVSRKKKHGKAMYEPLKVERATFA